MEHLSFKSGHAMQVLKLIKEDWPSFINTFMLKYCDLNQIIRFVCIALVMSVCLRYLLVTVH